MPVPQNLDESTELILQSPCAVCRVLLVLQKIAEGYLTCCWHGHAGHLCVQKVEFLAQRPFVMKSALGEVGGREASLCLNILQMLRLQNQQHCKERVVSFAF